MSNLLEDRRQQLIAQGKRGKKEKGDGKSRYEKRLFSRFSSSNRTYNNIDMDALFKNNILTVGVDVKGETDNYTVRMKFGGFLDVLQDQLKKSNNVFDLRTVIRALITAFNTGDVYIHCSCLHPTTRIKLLDGTSPTVQELCCRFESGEKLYGYSVDPKGDFIPGEIERVWITGQSKDFIEITLDNGEIIQTTPDHLYMLRNGTYLPASELQEGQSLMPLYFGNTKGYETIRYNSRKGCDSTYKMVATYFKPDEIRDAELRAQPEDNMVYKVAIHHKDFHKENNNPENLQVMTAKEHWQYHATLCGPDRPVTERIRETARQNAHKRNANPTPAMLEARRKFQEAGRARNYDEDRKQQQSALMKETMLNYYASWAPEEQAARSAQVSARSKRLWQEGRFDTPAFKEAAARRGEFLHTPEMEAKIKAGVQRYWDTMPEEARRVRNEICRQNVKKASDATRGVPKSPLTKQRMSAARLNEDPEKRVQRIQRCAHTKIETILREMLQQGLPMTLEQYNLSRRHGYPPLLNYFTSIEEAVSYFQLNHKVRSIKRVTLTNPIDVYDIKMKNEPNFLVSAGVILHNCPDFKFRHNFWATMSDLNSGEPEKRPSKITNPYNDLGPGCKHIMLILVNTGWLIKVASVIVNYVKYMERSRERLYQEFIYPAIYGKEYEGPIQQDIFGNELDSDKDTIDRANIEARKKGQFTKENPYQYQKQPDKDQLSMSDEEELDDEE